MFRRFGRHIKEGFIGFARHTASSVATVFTMFVSLLLVSFFLLLVFNLANLTKEVESSMSLSALVEYDLNDSRIQAIEKKISSIEGVSNIEYRSSEDEFNFYIEQNSDLKDFYEGYRDDNPFHATFLVNVADGDTLDDIKDVISKIDGIDSVHDGGDNTYKLIDILHKVRVFGLGLVIALILLAVYLIYNTIKLSVEGRNNEIQIMRIVGATRGFIRAPFLIEGMIIGFIGAFITILLSTIAYYYLYTSTNGVLLGAFDLLNPYPFLINISLVVLGIGLLTGFVGSYFSVTRILRKVR